LKRDIRDTARYAEALALIQGLRAPGTGQISDAQELHASPNGQQAVFSGTILDTLDRLPPTRICQVDLVSGDTQVLTFGPNTDRLPKYSPDGRHIGFLSDRHRAGDFQLYLLDTSRGSAGRAPSPEGWVEYFHWSPDGHSILLGVAGHGADVAGGQGAVTSKGAGPDLPSWIPKIETGEESFRCRRAWVYELATHRCRPVSPDGTNVWEAAWCGNDSIAAVVSPGPGEGLWYSARLHLIGVDTARTREVYAPQDQLGWPAASPSGEQLVIVDGLCSDRWIVAGEVQLIESSGRLRRIGTAGVDITYTEWRSERTLLLAGHRGLDTVVGLYDVLSDRFTELWVSRDTTTGGRYVSVSGLDDVGNCVLVGESFTRAPEIAVIREGAYRSVRSFDIGYAEEARGIGAVEPVTWSAPDGLEVQGWLLKPKAQAPHPLIMNIHGGPVWHWRPGWLGRGALVLLLLRRGHAVFFPNPRGSSGRGRDFVRSVYGDIGGADAQDLLSGLDALIERRVADPKRLGITGGSYGGFMTSWLITQDTRFAAAVPVAPHTNQVSEHLLSNLPHFMSLVLQDHYTNPGGKYFERSPIMHAQKAKTPTLNICGALDRCTPPEEAAQFHNALLESGVESVLVTYPEEGHGIRGFPASIDYAARVLSWFEEHMLQQQVLTDR
jgi:dipeptidyl aminopeptidase/acylaminoacyl peptidase